MTPIEESENYLIKKWGSNEFKGKGSIECIKPLNYGNIIAKIITTMRVRNPTLKIFIAVGKWEQRVKINNILKEYKINMDNITCITSSFINCKFVYHYDVSFIVGVNEWNAHTNWVVCNSKFYLMILTKDVIDGEKLAEIHKHAAPINANLSANDINNYRLSIPVEEEQIPVYFNSPNELATYNQYSEYITQVLQVFGDFNTITAARKGTINGKSSEQVLNELAEYNGWNSNMDMSDPFNAQIDKCYNPIILAEKASTCYDIIRKRINLVSDNSSKLDIILDLVKKNIDKKILIISKRGDFASTITNYLNENLGNIAGDYHDNITRRPLVDKKGVPVLYKSGAKKGQPKYACSKLISSLNLSAFELGDINVLSIKNASNSALKCATDLWIVTSSLCDSIDEIRYRFNNITINTDKLKVLKLYMADTIEEHSLQKEKSSPNHIIINNKENFFVSNEKIDDIVC